MMATGNYLYEKSFEKKEDIKEKVKSKLEPLDYNQTCDFEIIIDNIEYFIELKNKVQEMDR